MAKEKRGEPGASDFSRRDFLRGGTAGALTAGLLPSLGTEVEGSSHGKVLGTPLLAAPVEIQPQDYWTLNLSCQVELAVEGPLVARTTVTQPLGYSQVLEAKASFEKGTARWQLVYPLVDEGRFDVQPGTWNGFWNMGEYRFTTELRSGAGVVQTAEGTFDPMSVCLRDAYGPIVGTYPQQFIECSPDRPAYIDSDRMSFTIRTLPLRVAECRAIVDVVRPNQEEPLAGPWAFDLNGTIQRQAFDTSGWPRGEYWIRIRLLRNGQPAGPYVVRKVWKEMLPPETASQEPWRIGSRPQLLAGPLGFSSVQGIRFEVDPLDKRPDAPLVVMDKPWESELLEFNSLRFDQERREYVLEYGVGLRGDVARKQEFARLPSTIAVARSPDGIAWHKPELGLLDMQGSRANNLLPKEQVHVPTGKPGATLPPDHNLERARFRPYDPAQDGPVNLQKVFVTAVKKSFVESCRHASAQAYRVGSWPMERRGDEYLVLTSSALLFLGVGMDLYHTTEAIRMHVEDKSTGILYYFFRPGAPAYAPHDAIYDNMHMTRRCLGVMWTSDGMHWERRLIAVPDDQDPPGAQLYMISLFAEAQESVSGRPALAWEGHRFNVAIDGGQVYLGATWVFDAKAGRIWSEALWTRDLIHWQRFAARRKLIENGQPGSYNYGMVLVREIYHQFGDEWWFPYVAANTVHHDYTGLGKTLTLAQLQTKYPSRAEVPGFTNWEEYWEHCKSTRHLPAVARAPRGRVCYAEAIAERGELTTVPVRLEGRALKLNAAVAEGGSLRVEVLDQAGKPIAGFDRQACLPIVGDALAHKVMWKGDDAGQFEGQTVRLRFLIEKAKLYSFAVE